MTIGAGLAAVSLVAALGAATGSLFLGESARTGLLVVAEAVLAGGAGAFWETATYGFSVTTSI